MKRCLAVLAVATVFAPTARAAPPRSPQTASVDHADSSPLHESPSEKLSRARQAYARSDYDEAIRVTRPLLYPEVLLGFDDEIAAHKLLAMSYFFQREVNQAEQEFTSLLQLKEDFSLDPITDPPQAFTYVDSIRKRNRDKLDDLAGQKRHDEEQRKHDEEQRKRDDDERIRRAGREQSIVRTVERHHYALNFVPFGMGQFQNGDRGKGWALLSTQALLGAASLAIWATVYLGYTGSVNGATKPLNPADLDLARALTYAQVAIGALFWIDVGIGVIDALVHYKPTVVVERRLVDVDGQPLGRLLVPVPAPMPIITPFATPTGGGLAVQGAF